MERKSENTREETKENEKEIHTREERMKEEWNNGNWKTEGKRLKKMGRKDYKWVRGEKTMIDGKRNHEGE